LALSELKTAFEPDLRVTGVSEALVGALEQVGFRQVGIAIQRRTHRPALPPKLEAAGAFVRRLLTEKPLEPPSRRELVPDHLAQQALRFLIDTGEVVEISPEIVLSADAFALAVERVKAHLRRTGSATLSDLRQTVGSSRRIMVPLCEKLDREGVTVRAGDARQLGPRA
jgi:selenocysteine-specific elongation factor